MRITDFDLFITGSNYTAIVIRLVLAMVLGSLVGWERIAKHQSAGINTFALVSLGSAAATALNLYLSALPGFNADVSRIPAGVVSGIGFLGAGNILVTGRNQIKGLSTAATLWVTSCMGMAIGAGYLTVGICSFLLVAFANIVLLHVSNKVEEYSQYMRIYIEINKDKGVNTLTRMIHGQGFKIRSMTKSKEKTIMDSDTALIIDMELDKKRSHTDVLTLLRNLDYINYVEEV
jgi:putative Mg2+ transporter-C (MgtC) family protein